MPIIQPANQPNDLNLPQLKRKRKQKQSHTHLKMCSFHFIAAFINLLLLLMNKTCSKWIEMRCLFYRVSARVRAYGKSLIANRKHRIIVYSFSLSQLIKSHWIFIDRWIIDARRHHLSLLENGNIVIWLRRQDTTSVRHHYRKSTELRSNFQFSYLKFY